MDDAVLGRVGQSGRGLAHDAPGGPLVERAAAADQLVDVFADDQLHREVQSSLVPAEVVGRDDVRMGELGQRLGLLARAAPARSFAPSG